MAGPNEFAITITARDEATEILRKARSEMGQLATAGGQVEQALGLSKGSLDAFTGSLEKIAGTIPGLSGSFRALGSVMTASVAGAATGVTASLVAYGVALNRVADEQARFQRSLQSLNTDTLKGELARVNEELNRMADIGNRIGNESKTWTGALQSFVSRLQTLPQVARETFLGAETPEAQRARILAAIGGPLGAQEGARQTQVQAGIAGTEQRALLFQQQRRLNAEDLPGFLALQGQLEAADKRERDLALQAQRQRQQLELVPLQQAGIPTGAVEKTQALERQALAAELEIGLARQKLAREEQARALVERRIMQFQGRPIEGIEEVGRFEAAAPGVPVPELEMEAIRQRLFKIETQGFVGREAAPERGIEDVARFEGLAPGVRDAASTAAVEAGRRAVTDADERGRVRALDLGRENIQIEQQLIELQRQRTDLTRGQRDALELSISVQREQLQLADLTIQREREQIPEVQALIDKKKELVSAQESITRAVIEQQRLERTDPGAGAAAGLRDIEDIGAASGERMHQAFVSSFHDINRSFGDIVVDGLFNQGENAAEIGKQLGKRLVAGFVDQISSQLFARAFGAVGQAFGVTGRPLATAVPALTSPFAVAGAAGAGASAVAGVVEAGGGVVGSGYLAGATGGASASPALVSGPFVGRAATAAGGTDTGVTLLGQGIGIAKEFGGGFFGTQLSAYGVLSAYNAGGLAGVATAQALVGAGISETTAAAIVAQEAIGLGAVEGGAAASTTAAVGSTAAGLGATAASAAAGVIAAAALAYTAYSAYQSGDVVGGAIGGAVSGAALGTAIYPGIGTVVGLIAGAAIGGGAGAVGKEEQEVAGDRKRNEADRQRRGAWIYQDLMNAINGGIDHEDIAQQSVRTGHSVGGLLLGVAASNQSGFLSKPPWSWPPSENARKTLEILTGMGYLPILDFQWDRLNSTAELIASWHNPRGVTEGDIEIARNAEALMAAFVSKQGQTVLIGYDESLQTGLRGSAGDVTRTTLLRSDRAREAAGQDIFVVGGSTRGLDDAQLIRLMNRMVKLDRDGDLKILEIESDNGATVTTGNWSV